MTSDPWLLCYEGLDRDQESLREALCTLGNGAFATRGAAEEQRANGIDYPGTYVAGVYNQLASEVAGRTVVNEDLVNAPNWLWLTLRFPDGEWLDLWTLEVRDYRQELDLAGGLLRRSFRVVDGQGRITAIESRRLVHIEHPKLAAIEWRVVAENWSGSVLVQSGLDGAVTNTGVARYRQLASKHLEVTSRGPVAPEGIHLTARTSQSHIELAQAARTRVYRRALDGHLGDALLLEGRALDAGAVEGGVLDGVERRIVADEPERIAEELRVELHEGEEVSIEKTVALVSSRDRGISEAGVAARLAMETAPRFESLVTTQRAAWKRLWRRCDVQVEVDADHPHGDPSVSDQLVLRLHIFHLLQTASLATAERDVGIPARGLHGEAYRGHVFWDELFILPFYIQRMPLLARTVILYRYHRLDAARELARQAGCVGASFPWQSGSDGREVTQRLHLNPLSGSWDPDHSHLQRHVNSAIVYNIWTHYEATGDRVFLEHYGAEIILEIARFWSSLAKRNAVTGRYEISGVMGPDEYHEKYPDSEVGGLRNNAYTNITAVWCLLRARDALEAIGDERGRALRERLDIDDAEIGRWDEISRRMTVAFHDGVISQFEGYELLEELDWGGYQARYGHIARLDRLLKAEGSSPDRFKVSKQADVVMLLYLFGVEELQRLLGRLGYALDDESIRRSVEYYQHRTSHGSTLSKVVFTSAVHREDCEAGCRLFISALRSDLYDVQGGTTPEGVHLGAMAGTVDIATRHYAGLELRAGAVHLAPQMPLRMRRIQFRFQHHARWYELELTQQRLRLSVDEAGGEVRVIVGAEAHALPAGGMLDLEMEHAQVRRPASAVGDEPRVSVDESRLAGADS